MKLPPSVDSFIILIGHHVCGKLPRNYRSPAILFFYGKIETME